MLDIKWCKIVFVRVLLKSRTNRVCRRERLVVRNWFCCGAGKSNICRVGRQTGGRKELQFKRKGIDRQSSFLLRGGQTCF